MATALEIDIHPTEPADLDGLRALWADGDVMRFVGFPDGLKKAPEEMEAWLARIDAARPASDHFSVYYRGLFCGESYYGINPESGLAALDIKLFAFARGKGIATQALTHAIDAAFAHGAAKCYVDPNPANERALALYRRVGMVQKPMPEALRKDDYPGFLYYEIEREDWPEKRQAWEPAE